MTHEDDMFSKGIYAPKVTIEEVEASILEEYSFNLRDALPYAPIDSPIGLMTQTVIVMHNGFIVTGESVSVSEDNYSEEVGRLYSRHAALSKVRAILGYELKTKLSRKWANIDGISDKV